MFEHLARFWRTFSELISTLLIECLDPEISIQDMFEHPAQFKSNMHKIQVREDFPGLVSTFVN